MGGQPAGSCTAALFLKAFVDGIEPKTGKDEAPLRWAHIDIGGTMEVRDACGLVLTLCLRLFKLSLTTPYMEKGMSGRPVR